MMFHVAEGKNTIEHNMAKNSGNGKQYSMKLDTKDKQISNYITYPDNYLFFLSVELDSSISNSLPANYDTSTPWTFQVELLEKTKIIHELYDPLIANGDIGNLGLIEIEAQELAAAKGKLVIRRHHKWGEVPWHWKYSDMNRDEYDYPWDVNLQFNKPVK